MPKRETKSEKITLIMLHGWGGSGNSFGTLVEKISQKDANIRFVVPDFPGFGESELPDKSGWDTKKYADWLDELLHEMNINPTKDSVVFYGHSFGCRVIIRWLNKHPDFKGKIILTGAAGIKWPKTLKQKIVGIIAQITKPVRKILPTQNQKDSKTLWGKIMRKISRVLGFGDWSESSKALRPTLQKVLAEEDLRVYLPKIQNPTLLLWGAKDTYTPLKSAKIFQSQLQSSTLIVFEEGRHGIHYTHTEEISKLTFEFICNSQDHPNV